MYSVVLMMALTTSADTPDFCRGCRGCNGCYGCSGCWGCHGCRGCRGGWGCHGCRGCNGSYGGWGCSGCWGGCYGGWGCHGCHGTVPTTPAKGTDKKPEGSGQLSAPATILVNLPAEAKLLIDDHVTTSTSEQRRFASPALQPGKDFHYTLKAEMVRDGETVVATKKVSVRAGQETRVTLEFPAASVASR